VGYKDEIEVLREKINDIDETLVKLFAQRMHAVSEVADVKQKYGEAVYDASRESIVIQRALAHLEDDSAHEETRRFFHAVMDISKKRQQTFMDETHAGEDYFADKEGARVGYLGIPGSYSHIAALQATKGTAFLRNYSSFPAIFEGVKAGEIDYAMLPAENTETGSITAVVDLLAKYGYYIVGEKMLPVEHSLLALPGTQIDEIERIYTHPEVISQCSGFLAENPHIAAYPSLSTAQAAVTVRERADKTVACIASSQAAGIYGLAALREGIQNNKGNCTRFVVISRRPYLSPACNKTSVVLMLSHKPGSLYEMLGVFADGGVNILKLESRPLKSRPFEYLFHIDFEGSIEDEQVNKTIDKVKHEAAGYTYLGCYPRDKITL